jgi:hypothetical protein
MQIQLNFWNKKETRIYLNHVYIKENFGAAGAFEKHIDFGYIVYSKKEYNYSNVKSVSEINFANEGNILVNLDIEKLKLELQKIAADRNCKIYELAETSKTITL